jgi:hypothetical protein
LLLPLAFLCVPQAAAAQDPTVGEQPQSLRVFLDCGRCEFDHVRREVAFVDYVRDRADADLHVLVTSQETGGGGEEHTFFFIGLREFEGRQDTLRWIERQNSTEIEVRNGLTQTFKLGMIPFVARTPLAQDLLIQLERGGGGDEEQDEERSRPPAQDPWNLWVFRTSLGGSMDGESRNSSVSLDGSVSATRITEAMKLELSTSLEYSEDRFELNSGEELLAVEREYDGQLLMVWSLGPHWSTGFNLEASSSLRVNQNLAVRGGTALEYNIYPYAQSTRRQLTFLYTVGPVRFDYDQVTLFDRMNETRFEHSLDISAGFQQPWGEMDVSLEGSMFLHDASRHRLDFFTGFEIRLFRGLSLDLNGSVARIKNQLYEPREDIPDEDILLERRQLGTDFEYDLELGLSFTFGSVFNNIVNPRIRRGGGNDFDGR